MSVGRIGRRRVSPNFAVLARAPALSSLPTYSIVGGVEGGLVIATRARQHLVPSMLALLRVFLAIFSVVSLGGSSPGLTWGYA